MTEYTCTGHRCKRKFDEYEKGITQDDNKCILHCVKKDEYDEHLNELFNKVFKIYCDSKNYHKLSRIRLTGIHFPSESDFAEILNTDEMKNLIYVRFFKCHFQKQEYFYLINKLKLSFNECKFFGNVDLIDMGFLSFSNTNFYNEIKYINDSKDKVIVDNLDFNNCTFNSIDFVGLKLEKELLRFPKNSNNTSKNSIKLNELSLVRCHLNEKLFLNNSILVKKINFKDSIFDKKVEVKKCWKIYSLNFENAVFKKTTDLYGSSIVESSFYKTNFEDVIVLEDAIFEDDVNFTFTTFKKVGMFKRAIFKKCLNLEDSIILGSMNFLKMSSHQVIQKSISVKNRETARLIKDNFEQENNFIEANKYYALEMQERKKELSSDKEDNLFEWLVFKVHEISSNHSQNALLALFWIFTITFFYETLKNIEIMYTSFVIITYLILITFLFEFKDKFQFFIISILLILIFYIIYGSLSNDFQLYCIANTMNPFAIMTGMDELTFANLVYRAFMAYLIYQFVVSVRQNTRRK